MEHNINAQIQGYNLSNAVAYHYRQFPPTDLGYEQLIAPLQRAASALARYDAVLTNLHNKDLLLAPLRRQEAVISSRIEGTVATLDEVLTYEAADEEEVMKGTRKSFYRQEVIEVHSYIRALGYAQKLMDEGLPICERLVRGTQSRLLFWGRGADKQPGRFKTEQNYVVDKKTKSVLFTPISPDSLDTGFKNFEAYINNEQLEPLIQTAISHVEFEALHPFKDGNGRVGRMLITLLLWNRGLIGGPYFYISGYLENNRDEYIDRLRAVSADNAWTEWCVFFLKALEAQANENFEVAEQIVALYEDMKDQFRELLSSQWTMNALDFMFGKPVFRNSAFTSTSGIPKQTAARFTKILSRNGLLKTVLPASGRRSAVYSFEPLLEIVRT